jgi:AraC-like DNA-binding protein
MKPRRSETPVALDRETTINNPEDRITMIKAEDCAPLRLHRIAHVGWAEVRVPYARVRLQPSGSYLLICVEGEGRILLDGRWQACKPGMVSLAPPRALNAFHAVPGKKWTFCWVRYDEPAGINPVVSAASPVRTRCNPSAMFAAIRGLAAELSDRAEARFLHHWVELIHGGAVRLAQPWHVNERLWKIWTLVERDVAAEWSAGDLAKMAHCSKEHLRRLCIRELGRTPMQQVTSIRMQRAAAMLESTDDKLATIATVVGYGDAFVLSKVFKKWMGCSPSDYRTGRTKR